MEDFMKLSGSMYVSMKNKSNTCLKHWGCLSFYTMRDHWQGQIVTQTQTQQSEVNNQVQHLLSPWHSEEEKHRFRQQHGKMYVVHSQGSKKCKKVTGSCGKKILYKSQLWFLFLFSCTREKISYPDSTWSMFMAYISLWLKTAAHFYCSKEKELQLESVKGKRRI